MILRNAKSVVPRPRFCPAAISPCATGYAQRRFSTSTELDSDNDLPIDEVLINQDPYKRIRFSRPVAMMGIFSEWGRRMHLKKIWPHMVHHEAAIIPFWNMAIICDQRTTARHLTSGSPDYGNTPQRFYTEVDLSLAAVPDDHWCSGVYFRMNLHRLAEVQQLVSSHPGSPFSQFMPSSKPSIYTLPTDGAHPYLPSGLYNPLNTPKFAFGPPKLDKTDMDRIVESQASGALVSTEWEEIFSRARDIKIYFMPTYRMVYRIDTLNGTINVTDTEARDGNRNITVDWPRGQCRRLTKADHEHSRLSYFRVNPSVRPRGMVSRLIDSTGTSAIVTTLFNAMRRSGPITPSMWEDGRILPLVGQDGTPDLLSVAAYAEATLSGKIGVEPSFPIKRATTSSTTGLFSLFDMNPKPKLPVAPPLTGAPASGKGKAGQPKLSPAASSEPKKPLQRILSGSSLRERRQAKIDKYAEDRAGRIGGSKGRVHRGLLLALPHDKKRYYAELGFKKAELTQDFLDEMMKEKVDAMIRDRYHELAKIRHSDMGGKHEAAARLNVAKESIETLELRKLYFTSGIAAGAHSK